MTGTGDVDLRHHGDAEIDPSRDELDLAVNVRRRRPPAWLAARLADAVDSLGGYPRPEAAVAAVAARHDRPADEVLLTNGAAEAFALVAGSLPIHRAVCIHPSFTGPEAALRDAGHQVERVVLREPFDLDPDAIPADADLVVLGNPTNPTGRLHPASVIASLARPGRYLVVDEAFADAVAGEPESLSSRRDLPGLIVVRSLTKTWGLAGLRVGYLLTDPATRELLARAQPDWPVNSLALTALEACSDPAAVEWAERQAEQVLTWRATLAEALGAVPGVSVVPGGEAPFLLLRVADGSAVRERLLERGIVVRRGDTFPGLGPDWLRVAAVSPDQHSRVVNAFIESIRDAPASSTPTAAVDGASTGSVTLVGAGPGGADLITIRGWRALHRADVVVADRLADDALTDELRPGVELIDAGKAPGRHRLKQEAINALLVERALGGRHVVRLKGGDPYVFGRGSEEVNACVAAGVPCTVVPGLSSVTAAPALAGIPITRRDYTQSFTVVSGHLPPGHAESRIDWTRLAASAETLVLLMAVGQLPAITSHLLANGRSADTPAAVIESAGTDQQRVTGCDLAGLVAACEAAAVANPAVVVIGASVGAAR